MINEFLLQSLGWQRLQDDLRFAERQRLVRVAEGRSREPAWAKVTRLLSKGAATTDDGGRIPPDASRAGEMPGL